MLIQILHLLYAETSEQLGTSEIVGAYSTRDGADNAALAIQTRRTFIKEIWLDAPPTKTR